jgi:SAM-dependent methyltransferase
MEDSSVDLVRASHVMEHIPTEDRIHCMNEVHRVLKPGGMFEVIVPLFPSWQAMADPTHVSYWVEQSFWYFTGQWAPQAEYGMLMWRWATTTEIEQSWRDHDPGPAVRAQGLAPWLVVDGWEGHALIVKPERA